MRKKHFTIVELLVAMAIMMIMVNMLAKVYTSFSSAALSQSSTTSTLERVNTTLDIIENDINKMVISCANVTINGNLRSVLQAGYITYSTTTSYIHANNGWPRLSFTTLLEDSTEEQRLVSDGYVDVLYHVYHSDAESNLSLNCPEDHLNIYRVYTPSDNSIYNTGSTSTQNFSQKVGSSNLLLDNVTYFGFRFGDSYISNNTNITNTYHNWNSSQPLGDGSNLLGNGSHQFFPAYIDIEIALGPIHGSSDMFLELTSGTLTLSMDTWNDVTIDSSGNIQGSNTATSRLSYGQYRLNQFNGQPNGYAYVMTGTNKGLILYYAYRGNGTSREFRFMRPASSSTSNLPASISSNDRIRLSQTFRRRCLLPN